MQNETKRKPKIEQSSDPGLIVMRKNQSRPSRSIARKRDLPFCTGK
jgi:hypothetical protein